jgi:glycosyl transferase family 4
MRLRFLIVSYFGSHPLTPRGARTQAIARALRRRADVRVVTGPAPETRRTRWHRGRDRVLSELGTRYLMDSYEPWSWRAIRRLETDVHAAVLIGYPFSPLVPAAQMLRSAGIPYVVDVSDPWALTRANGGRATWRDRRNVGLERELWAGAAAGIVTTEGQRRAVSRFVPTLEMLVRPNGYSEPPPDGPRGQGKHARGPDLSIGHFGNLYAPRLSVIRFIERIVDSRCWRRVTLHQYGRDHYGELRRPPVGVTVEAHDPVPWPDVVRLAAERLDLALVVGNTDPTQLPSKAIEYLTLPVPRLALTSGHPGDALAEYVDGKPGWLTVPATDEDPAKRIADHVMREWTVEDLAPPADESWPTVAEQLADFIIGQIRPGLAN